MAASGYLLTGLLLGLSAGLAPGPLLALVVAETMRHGSRAGVRVALAPLLTDLPIILITLLTVAELSRFHPVLGIISLLGGGVVCRLGWENLRCPGINPGTDIPLADPKSLRKGVAVNLLSPHPWLFWFAVGAPLLLRALHQSPIAAVGFVGFFYLALVGCKLLLARLVGRFRTGLRGPVYLWLMRLLGMLLLLFALLLFRDGYHLLRG